MNFYIGTRNGSGINTMSKTDFFDYIAEYVSMSEKRGDIDFSIFIDSDYTAKDYMGVRND